MEIRGRRIAIGFACAGLGILACVVVIGIALRYPQDVVWSPVAALLVLAVGLALLGVGSLLSGPGAPELSRHLVGGVVVGFSIVAFAIQLDWLSLHRSPSSATTWFGGCVLILSIVEIGGGLFHAGRLPWARETPEKDQAESNRPAWWTLATKVRFTYSSAGLVGSIVTLWWRPRRSHSLGMSTVGARQS